MKKSYILGGVLALGAAGYALDSSDGSDTSHAEKVSVLGKELDAETSLSTPVKQRREVTRQEAKAVIAALDGMKDVGYQMRWEKALANLKQSFSKNVPNYSDMGDDYQETVDGVIYGHALSDMPGPLFDFNMYIGRQPFISITFDARSQSDSVDVRFKQRSNVGLGSIQIHNMSFDDVALLTQRLADLQQQEMQEHIDAIVNPQPGVYVDDERINISQRYFDQYDEIIGSMGYEIEHDVH